MSSLITIKNCRIENSKGTIIPNINWEMKTGEAWLVIGPNGGGKADFMNALSHYASEKFVPNQTALNDALFSSVFGDSVDIVSLERAAKLIQEERENDESEYVEGGVDIGRTGRIFLAEALVENPKKNPKVLELAASVEKYHAIKLCGIEKILDRGLKYMSTGEIRRTLLARSLISSKKLIILSDPFAGLDIQSRTILLDFFNNIAKSHLSKNDSNMPSIILAMERWHEIPDAITHVLEFKDKKISFCGTRKEYEKNLSANYSEEKKQEEKESFTSSLNQTFKETQVLQNQNTETTSKVPLVEMHNVNVGWGDHKVLRDLNWTLYQGEHWLIQGPNGSGKTTFLELITGNNMQVFSNDIKIFGNRRGSGETIWDIKKQLGIVSYRLHVEYRMVGVTSLQNVIISGFKDSIGLYETPSDVEIAAAKQWLKLGGFEGRENESFGNLSYGEQRALLILRSAVKSPKIMILDEPCHGLDENQRDKVLNIMETVGKGNTTTILHVTHDPSEIIECEKHVLQLVPDQDPMYIIKTL